MSYEELISLCAWLKVRDNVKVLVVLNWKSLKIFGPTVFATDRFDFQTSISSALADITFDGWAFSSVWTLYFRSVPHQ